MLATFNEKEQAILKVNASDYVMSACLIQKKKLIVYFFKTFQSTKINYDIKDKKLLTMIFALQN